MTYLARLLAPLLCLMRGVHVPGSKFRRADKWYQACVVCGHCVETTEPKRRAK